MSIWENGYFVKEQKIAIDMLSAFRKRNRKAYIFIHYYGANALCIFSWPRIGHFGTY